MGENRFTDLINKARETNTERDEIDHSSGFAIPNDCEPIILLATAMGAIKTGILLLDWDCIAEGYVMLEQLINRKGEIL